MAGRGYIEKKKREAEKEIAAKNRSQSDVESRRGVASNILSSIIGAGGRVAAKMQHPEWYNKWIDSTLFSGLPSFRNVITPCETIQNASAYIFSASPQIGNTSNSTPYVMGLRYCSHIGKADNTGAPTVDYPCNNMFVKVLSNLAKVNSRPVQQDSDVFGLYLSAVAEIAKFLGWIKTNVELSAEFNSEQSSLNRALLLARCHQNVTVVQAFLNERAAYEKVYNEFSNRFNEELPIMKDLSLLARRWWVSCVVIKEHDSKKPQYITFDPSSFLCLDVDATKLEPQYSVSTPAYVAALLDTMFNRIATDVDMQTLIGNIRAACSESDFWKVPSHVDEKFEYLELDHNALHQFHNLTTLPAGVRTLFTSALQNAFETITSNGSEIIQSATFKYAYSSPQLSDNITLSRIRSNGRGSTVPEVLDFYTDNVNSDVFNEATRLRTVYRPINITDRQGDYAYIEDITYELECCGTEVIYYGVTVDWSKYNSAFVFNYLYTYDGVGADYTVAPGATLSAFIAATYGVLNNITIGSRFDWMFLQEYALSQEYTVTTNGRQVITHVQWETNRLVEVGPSTYKQLNRACLYSEYYSDPTQFKRQVK